MVEKLAVLIAYSVCVCVCVCVCILLLKFELHLFSYRKGLTGKEEAAAYPRR